MKKILSMILVLTMIMGLPFTCFAANSITNGGMDSVEVKGTYNSNATVAVYSVDILWEGLEFTYNGDFQGTWNPESHKYEGGTTAGWAEGSGKITVTNHSNTGITATPSYIAKDGFESVSMNFSNQILEVATADNGKDGKDGTAVTGIITVTPDGSLPEGTESATIGTIMITIN